MYNITPTTTTEPIPGNELGIFEEGDFYNAQDLELFFTFIAQ
jgi:hypothetical protein